MTPHWLQTGSLVQAHASHLQPPHRYQNPVPATANSPVVVSEVVVAVAVVVVVVVVVVGLRGCWVPGSVAWEVGRASDPPVRRMGGRLLQAAGGGGGGGWVGFAEVQVEDGCGLAFWPHPLVGVLLLQAEGGAGNSVPWRAGNSAPFPACRSLMSAC